MVPSLLRRKRHHPGSGIGTGTVTVNMQMQREVGSDIIPEAGLEHRHQQRERHVGNVGSDIIPEAGLELHPFQLRARG